MPAVLEVEVLPLQPQCLTLPEAEGKGDRIKRLKPIATDALNEAARLIRLERSDLRPTPPA